MITRLPWEACHFEEEFRTKRCSHGMGETGLNLTVQNGDGEWKWKALSASMCSLQGLVFPALRNTSPWAMSGWYMYFSPFQPSSEATGWWQRGRRVGGMTVTNHRQVSTLESCANCRFLQFKKTVGKWKLLSGAKTGKQKKRALIIVSKTRDATLDSNLRPGTLPGASWLADLDIIWKFLHEKHCGNKLLLEDRNSLR